MAISKGIIRTFNGLNLLFLLAGAAAMSVGCYFMTNKYARRNAVLSADNVMSLIGIGLIVTFTACVGFFGSLSPVSRKPMLVAFSITIVGIVVVQVIMGILIWYKTLTMHIDFREDWRSWSDTLRANFQEMNPNAICCGYKDPTDSPAPVGQCVTPTVNIPGCMETVFQYADTYLRNIYTCVFGSVIIDVFVFFAGIVVIQAANEEERYEKMAHKVMAVSGEMKMQFL